MKQKRSKEILRYVSFIFLYSFAVREIINPSSGAVSLNKIQHLLQWMISVNPVSALIVSGHKIQLSVDRLLRRIKLTYCYVNSLF